MQSKKSNRRSNEAFHASEKLKRWSINPFKTSPSGEPFKNGLLGRFLTFRKDDYDVEYRCPPPSPPPGLAGYEIVGDIFSAFLTQDNDKKLFKIL
jgi:hypothetical protein